MVFLFVHFGEHRVGGWRYARDVYGALGADELWDWEHVSTEPEAFRAWMLANVVRIKSRGPGGFGNHRKYERLELTGDVVASYVDWVGPTRAHQDTINAATAVTADGREAFAELYRSMRTVRQFGRTACFDYLSKLYRLGLAPITPDRAYIVGATGPFMGSQLLLGTTAPRSTLDGMLVALDDFLGLGMDTLEDAVCNWQKSPDTFRPFRG